VSGLDLLKLDPVYPDGPGRPSITVTLDGRLYDSDATRQHGAKIPRCCDRPAPAFGMAAWTDMEGGRVQLAYCQNCRTGLAVFRWRVEG
jgi:hypothetical protein